MKTPFLDLLIEEHKNHIESVEVSSYSGISETRKQLAELENIKAIIVKDCFKSNSEQLLAVAKYVYWNYDESSSKKPEDYLKDFLQYINENNKLTINLKL